MLPYVPAFTNTAWSQVTPAEVLPLGVEIGVRNGKIAVLGQDLEATPETQVVDAEGAYITPGCALPRLV